MWAEATAVLTVPFSVAWVVGGCLSLLAQAGCVMQLTAGGTEGAGVQGAECRMQHVGEVRMMREEAGREVVSERCPRDKAGERRRGREKSRAVGGEGGKRPVLSQTQVGLTKRQKKRMDVVDDGRGGQGR